MLLQGNFIDFFCAEGPDLRAVFSWHQSRFVAVFLSFVRKGGAECLGEEPVLDSTPVRPTGRPHFRSLSP